MYNIVLINKIIIQHAGHKQIFLQKTSNDTFS